MAADLVGRGDPLDHETCQRRHDGRLAVAAKLHDGEFVAAEFKRIGKNGREVWIQASYNPIFDLNGKVAKVVKFATDVTERVRSVNGIANGLQALSNADLAYRITERFDPAFE
ncbi:PAS domain-containing protein, partial [Cutibacterium acnes]